LDGLITRQITYLLTQLTELTDQALVGGGAAETSVPVYMMGDNLM